MKKVIGRLLLVLLLAVSLPTLSFASHRQQGPTSAKQQAKIQKKQIKQLEKLQRKQEKQQLKAQKKANKQLKKRREQGYAF